MSTSNPLPPPTRASAPATAGRGRRGRLTLAGVVALALTGGGAVAAEAAFASGGATSGPSTASGPARPAAPAAARPAAPGRYDLDGTVTAASSSQLTVRSGVGTSRTYALTSGTRIHAGPRGSATTASLTVGTHVHVRGERVTAGLQADDVDLRAAHIDGTVTAVSDSAITVTDPDGFTRTIDLSSSTTYTTDGAASTRSTLTAGRFVHAEGKVDQDGTSLDAATVDVRTKEPTPPAGRPAAGPAGPPAPYKPGAPRRAARPTGAPSTGAPSTGASGSTSRGR